MYVSNLTGLPLSLLIEKAKRYLFVLTPVCFILANGFLKVIKPFQPNWSDKTFFFLVCLNKAINDVLLANVTFFFVLFKN